MVVVERPLWDYVDLSEYISRRARYRLVQACLEYYEKLAEESGVSPTRALAHTLGVSQRTVQRWAHGGIQSCNPNANEIIHTSLVLVPKKASEILREDLEEHVVTLQAALATHPGAAVAGAQEEVAR